MTASEIRDLIRDTVLENGGHLASSLGAVELAMALAEVFDPNSDRIVWDVGHQSYAWKILTGRADSFPSLRRFNGLSGFPSPHESPADAAVAGHAGVAISVAEGFAFARDKLGKDAHVVAVVGDGTLTNGTCFEAINNCASATGKLIIVLNDNRMSISKSTGALSRFLGRLIANVHYNRIKSATEAAGHRMGFTFLRGAYHRVESFFKGMFLGSAFFERFGLRYIGPVDGHDLKALKAALTVARNDKRSVLVHVVTVKGKGYAPAENDPVTWHGVSPRRKDPAPQAKPQQAQSWSQAMGETLCALAREDKRICAITAAMEKGTGLAPFAAEFPDRFRDVGIAEGHMVAFAAGLAAGGMRPFVAVYSTFLQRAIDQVMHDVCIANLPVVFCVDRAGVVGEDGATHQGIYDFAMLKCLPNLTIVQPSNAADLASLIREALGRNGPTVIRYPRGAAPSKAEPLSRPDARIAIWTPGDWLAKANEVAELVGGTVVHARSLKPFDEELLRRQRAAGMKIICIENGCVAGGFGESIGADMKFGWPDSFVPHGSTGELERAFKLDAKSIADAILHDGHASPAAMVPAHAKVNVRLSVLGKRPDGFHDLNSIVMPLALHDDVEVRLDCGDDEAGSPAGGPAVSIDVVPDGVDCSALCDPNGNLCAKAARAFFARLAPDAPFRRRVRGIAIRVVKRIPLGGGLGGGSADAAATLRALASLAGDDAPGEEALLAAAAEVGSDVPALLLGGPALMEGRGEKVMRLPKDTFAPLPVLLANPGVPVSTPAAYAALDRLVSSPSSPSSPSSSSSHSSHSSHSSPSSLRSAADYAAIMENDLEEPVFSLCPAVAETAKALRNAGARALLMSGSGATVFAIADDDAEAKRLADAMPPDVWTCLTRLAP